MSDYWPISLPVRTHSPLRITGKTVCWERLNKYITKNKLVVEDGW